MKKLCSVYPLLAGEHNFFIPYSHNPWSAFSCSPVWIALCTVVPRLREFRIHTLITSLCSKASDLPNVHGLDSSSPWLVLSNSYHTNLVLNKLQSVFILRTSNEGSYFCMELVMACHDSMNKLPTSHPAFEFLNSSFMACSCLQAYPSRCHLGCVCFVLLIVSPHCEQEKINTT